MHRDGAVCRAQQLGSALKQQGWEPLDNLAPPAARIAWALLPAACKRKERASPRRGFFFHKEPVFLVKWIKSPIYPVRIQDVYEYSFDGIDPDTDFELYLQYILEYPEDAQANFALLLLQRAREGDDDGDA